MIVTIARHEIKSMFLSPLAWVILGVLQLLLGYMFLAPARQFLSIATTTDSFAEYPGCYRYRRRTPVSAQRDYSIDDHAANYHAQHRRRKTQWHAKPAHIFTLEHDRNRAR